MDYCITEADISAFRLALRSAERSAGTVAQYGRAVSGLRRWLDGRGVSQELLNDWKGELASRYSARTVNAMLAAVNCFCKFAGTPFRLRFLKVQRAAFRDAARELTRTDYERLLRTAEGSGQRRLALIMETLCATGIRISELRYITVEAAQAGRATISLKGKIRTILLSTKLCRKLLKYARKQKIASGEVFLTKSGKPITRRQVWYELKRLCKAAGVEASKVFPHNFRHLFATIFYRACKDIARLADVLGHSSIETTRIYLTVSGTEQARQLDRLGLVS